MKDIPSTSGRKRLTEWVAQGEHETQDFKFSVSDPRKIARSLSAFANNKGGRLLLGVKDNGTIAGVRNEEDIFVLEQAGESYCIPPVEIEFNAYSYDARTRVIVASVRPSDKKPVRVRESDGKLKAYFRVADENIVAHPLMERSWELAGADTPIAMSLGNAESVILRHLSATPARSQSPKDIALAVHLSLQTVENALPRLAVMNLIRFVFDGTSFLIENA